MKKLAGLTFVVGVSDDYPMYPQRLVSKLCNNFLCWLYCHEDEGSWFLWDWGCKSDAHYLSDLLDALKRRSEGRLTLTERFELARYAMPRLIHLIDAIEDELLQLALLKAAGQK